VRVSCRKVKDLNPLSRHIGARIFGVAALTLLLAGTRAGSQQPASAVAFATLPPRLQEVFNQGVQALNAGQLDTAEKAFLRVLNEGGKVAFVYNNLGIVYQQRRERERALAQFREAIRLQPDYAAPRVLMGSVLLAMGRFPEAARELETASEVARPRQGRAAWRWGLLSWSCLVSW
jgi:Flp pilus assembly protein TadD